MSAAGGGGLAGALRDDEDLGVAGDEVSDARARARVIDRPRRTDAATV